MIRLGIVSDNLDPANLRRVKVITQDRGTSVSSWVSRVSSWDGSDLPVPPIGSTVIVASMQDDTTDEVVLGVLQTETSNQPDRDKDGSLGDWFSSVFGSIRQLITGTLTILTQRDITLQVDAPNQPTIRLLTDGTIRLQNKLGSVTLLPNGYTVFVNPSGTWQITSNGFQINHDSQVQVNSPSFVWNGQQVARVGGTDTDGDLTLS